MARKRTTPEGTVTEPTTPTESAALNRGRGPSANRVTLIGRCVASAELRYTANGIPFASLRIATNDRAQVEYHNIVLWRQQAEFAAKFLAKGRLVHIEGHLQTRTWQAQDGSTRRSVEIVAGRVQALSAKPDADVE